MAARSPNPNSRTRETVVTPSESACSLDIRISVPPTVSSGATNPIVKVRWVPSAATSTTLSPAWAPRKPADVAPITIEPPPTTDAIGRPISAPIAETGSTVVDIGIW